MKLSEKLQQMHDSGDVWLYVESFIDEAKFIESVVDSLTDENRRLDLCLASKTDIANQLKDNLSDAFMRKISQDARIAELEAVNEQLAHELSVHEPSTDKLADLAVYCVQRNIGAPGQDAHKAIMAHCDALADHLSIVLQTHADNSGFEPSLSVFQREIDRAMDYLTKRQCGE